MLEMACRSILGLDKRGCTVSGGIFMKLATVNLNDSAVTGTSLTQEIVTSATGLLAGPATCQPAVGMHTEAGTLSVVLLLPGVGAPIVSLVRAYSCLLGARSSLGFPGRARIL
jgi:hypothetical protein